MKSFRISLFTLCTILLISVFSHGQIIRTIAGCGFADAVPTCRVQPAIIDTIGQIQGVAVDPKGNVYISDNYYNVIKKVTPRGIISCFAGVGYGGCAGDGGAASAAQVSAPYAVTCDAIGNLYIADAGNKAVRKVDTNGVITTVAGILCTHSTAYYNGDGIPATDAVIGGISGVCIDNHGNLYIADANSRVRKVTTDGIIHTVAGNGSIGYGGDGTLATGSAVSMDGPVGVDVDDAGNIYVVDQSNQVVRKITTDGIIHVFAGRPGLAGAAGNGGPATAAKLNTPNAIRHDAHGNFFIADMGNSQIRKVDTNGIITLYCGSSTSAVGFSGDGGPASAATLAHASDLCFDHFGNMFIADKGNGITSLTGHRIREIFTRDTMHITLDHGDTLCGYQRVRFTAQEPVAHYWSGYRWNLNGRPVGFDSATYFSDTVNDGDLISCTKYDTAHGGIWLAVSDTIRMTARPIVVPHVHLTSSGDTVCAGQRVWLTAHPVHGGPSPVYTWSIFSVPTDSTGSTFNFVPGLGAIVTCSMLSDELCAVPDTASTIVTMHVNPSIHPTIRIVPKEGLDSAWGDTLAYYSQIVTFFPTTTYGGATPSFQWYQDNVPVAGATNSIFAQSYYANHYIYCIMQSSENCVVPTFDTSNQIHISVYPLSVGVNEIHAALSHFNIHPDPNDGNFTVNATIESIENGFLEAAVVNVVGQKVANVELPVLHHQINSKIALANVPVGMYMLTIHTVDGVHTSKFVVNR